MSDVVKTNRLRIRRILLLLVFVTSPLCCCGISAALDALPASILPPALDFMLNLFEGNAHIENKSSETFYLTPITTTYGRPMVIPQTAALRQRDFPLPPNASITLGYDSADMPLAGIAVCRSNTECRLLAVDYSNEYVLRSFEDLPELEPGWLTVIRAYPEYNYMFAAFFLLGLIPLGLFSGWLYLGRTGSASI